MTDVTRRDFIKLGAAGLASAVLAGCDSPRRWVHLEPYVRPPEEQLAGIATWYASTCCQCPAGCGIVVRVMNGRALKIEGNREHPLNRGKLCAQGQAGLQQLYNPDRLPGVVRQAARGSRDFAPLSWEEGMNDLFATLQAAGGAVAVWTGSTTPDHLYTLFQRFTGAVGAPPPLLFDQHTALHGYNLFANAGTPLLPGYVFASADVVVSFGADLFTSSLSPTRYGLEFGAFRSQPLGKRGYLVQVEPRMSPTGAVADRWLPIRPGREGLVAAALLQIIADEGMGSAERASLAGSLAGQVDVRQVADASDVPVAALYDLAQIIAAVDTPVAIPGGAMLGLDAAAGAMAAIDALNALATTPPAARAAPPDGVTAPAAASFGDVQALIDSMRAGDVQVLLVHNANPAYDLPEAAGFLDALENVPTVISFAPIIDETAAFADLILPDRTYLESWGHRVVSPNFGTPIVGSQQPVVPPVFDARSTGDLILAVAQGIPAAAGALPWADEVAYLKQLVAQFPPGAYEGSGEEVLWARFLQHGGWWPAPGEAARGTMPPPGRAVQPAQPAFEGDESQYPYFLHIYTSPFLGAGRGANLPWLQGSPEPMTTMAWQTWVEIHPDTAAAIGVEEGDVVRVTSPNGSLEAPVYIYPGIRPDTVAIPTGQGHTDCGRYARDRGANPMRLVGARAGGDGNLLWASQRVGVAPVGTNVGMARFGNRVGVTEGFINEEFPGR